MILSRISLGLLREYAVSAPISPIASALVSCPVPRSAKAEAVRGRRVGLFGLLPLAAQRHSHSQGWLRLSSSQDHWMTRYRINGSPPRLSSDYNSPSCRS